MRLVVIAVGRNRAGPARDLFDDYAARIRKLGPGQGIQGFDLIEIAESRAATPALRAEREGQEILDVAAPAQICVFDERGEDLPSTDVARLISRERDGGTAAIALVIGGPDGLAEPVRDRAARIIAFGRATWPHLLARAMLAEQVYRALTILGRHPYHRG